MRTPPRGSADGTEQNLKVYVTATLNASERFSFKGKFYMKSHVPKLSQRKKDIRVIIYIFFGTLGQRNIYIIDI